MLDEVYVQVSQKGIDEVINKKHLKELYKNIVNNKKVGSKANFFI